MRIWWLGCTLFAGIVAAGCMLERSPIVPVADGGGGCTQSSCPPGQVCVGGTCQSMADDGDGDGVPAAEDCDDTNASVGSTAERACSSACATGLERCSSGTWAPCDAPSECTCTAGDTRSVSCAMCGVTLQHCEEGTWVDDDGTCTNQGECVAGSTESNMQACGCTGTQTQTRTCSDTCTWGEWSDFGECTGGGACMPGEIGTEMQSCGCGGTQMHMRTCTASCGWGEWSPWGACSGGGECTPGETSSEMQACGCRSAGTQTHTRTCTASCTWGAFGAWGACSVDAGVCTPGEPDSETRSCGTCGGGSQMHTRSCDPSCNWGAWSAWGTCSGDVSCSYGGDTRCVCGTLNGFTCCADGDWSRIGCSGC